MNIHVLKFIYLFVRSFIRSFVCLFVCLFVCSFVCLFVYLFISVPSSTPSIIDISPSQRHINITIFPNDPYYLHGYLQAVIVFYRIKDVYPTTNNFLFQEINGSMVANTSYTQVVFNIDHVTFFRENISKVLQITNLTTYTYYECYLVYSTQRYVGNRSTLNVVRTLEGGMYLVYSLYYNYLLVILELKSCVLLPCVDFGI